MMYLRYQASLFGDFSNIYAENNTISQLMKMLSGYEVIPTVFNEVDINLNKINRIQLFSPNKKLFIKIKGNRIDIETNISPKDSNHSELYINHINSFINDVNEIYKTLLNFFKKSGNRISLVSSIYDGYNDSKNIQEKYRDMIKQNTFFDNKDVFEWSIRSVTHENISINGEDEILNVLSDVRKERGIISNLESKIESDFDGLVYSIDINTIPSNKETRIDDNFINQFYENAIKIKEVLEKGYYCEQ